MPLTEGVMNSFSFCVNVWAIVLTATLVKFLDVLTGFTVAVHMVHPLVGNNFRHNLEIGLCFYGFDFEYILKIGLVEPGHTQELGTLQTVAGFIVEEPMIPEGVIHELASSNKIFPEDSLRSTFAWLYRNGNECSVLDFTHTRNGDGSEYFKSQQSQSLVSS